MGHFLAVSAFKDTTPEALESAIIDWAGQYKVVAKPLVTGTRSLSIYAPRNGWTVVLWPPYFNILDVKACQALSAKLATTASTLHVYDDDYWVHTLIARGEVLDRFASFPKYFDEDLDPTPWKGNAALLAQHFGVEANTLAKYLVHGEDGPPSGRANDGDEFELDDFWVMTDFWRRAGITYPEDPAQSVRTLELSSERDLIEVLPTDDNL
ncbi:MAG: hypothetical protein U0228_24955 [Myxococcaceae bacterium]